VLIDIGEPAVPALIETMRDENEAVCTIATVVLSHIGQPVAPGLIAALRDEVELVRIHAALALKRIDTLEATKAVGEYEKQKD
jgi:HEAT repeat protein